MKKTTSKKKRNKTIQINKLNKFQRLLLLDEYYWYKFQTSKDQETLKKILRSNFICYVRFIYTYIFKKTLKGFKIDLKNSRVEFAYALAKFLEDTYKLQCRKNLKKFYKYHIINIPPRFGKTELCAVFHSWYFGRNPESHFLGSSYSESLTTESCKKVKFIIKTHFYQWIFPDTVIAKDCDTANFFKTTKRGEYYTPGITGTITGRGAGNDTKNTIRPNGFIFLDDPLKAGDANSPIVRNAVNDTFLSTFLSRCNHPYVHYLIIMQRLHTEDLCGFLKSSFPNEPTRKLVLPALIGNKPLCSTNANKIFLKDLQNENPEVFWSQYMQKPAQEADLVFDIKQIFTLDNEPPKELLFHSFTVADTSMVNKPNADFTVFGHFYVYAVPNWMDYWDQETNSFRNKHEIVKLLLREISVTKIDAKNLLDIFQIFLDHLLEKATLPPDKVYIETKVSGIALFQEINSLKDRGGKYFKSGFSLQELGKENSQKELRFANISHLVKDQKFEILRDDKRSFINSHSTTQFIKDHLSKISRIKNSSINDDIADIITYALTNAFIGARDNRGVYLGHLQQDVISQLTHKMLRKNYLSHYH